jgi:hypothetical protein
MITLDKLKGPLGWSIAALIVLFVFLCIAFAAIISPFFAQAGDTPSNSRMVALVVQYDENNAADIARFNGRSAFFKPIRIARPTPPPPPKIEVADLPPPPPPAPVGPPPAPATYTGPKLIAIIGNEAWFRNGSGSSPVIRLQMGEEKDGLKLLSTLEPTMVKVQHRRGTYEIDLFSADEPFFREEPLPSSTHDFFKEVEG